MTLVVAITVGTLFGCGVHLMARGDAIKLAAGAVLISNAAVLLLLSAGTHQQSAPLLPAAAWSDVADPLVQAVAITALVIGVATTILLLRVALELERTHDTLRMEDLVRAETAEDEQDEQDEQDDSGATA